MSKLVTIIIPVYNVEKYLEKCLRSIISQTYENLQIIIVNDGSTDKSLLICEEMAVKDNRIKIINKENGGLSDARNRGIEESEGEYILFVDSDDYIEKEAVYKLLRVAEENKLEIVSANANKLTNNKKQKLIKGGISQEILSGKEYIIQTIQDNNYSATCCIRLYQKKLLVDNNLLFKKGILHEDEEWTPRVFMKATRVMHIDYCFYNYVIRQNSITQSFNKRRNIIDIINICLGLETLYNENFNQVEKNVCLDYLARIYMATCTMGKYEKKFYESVIDKNFVKRNSYSKGTKFKSLIYCLNINLYRLIKLMNNKQEGI